MALTTNAIPRVPHTELPISNLRVYNTLTRHKQPFTTIEPGKVRMYVCGVTVYDAAHIGHGMSAITFDVIRRYLEYLGYDVNHAQNFTDIDDKIINRANQEGIEPSVLTDRLVSEWLDQIRAIGTIPATSYPKATEEVPQIITMIEGLIASDHAYSMDGDVYFRVRSFPGYGKLSGRDLDDLQSGSRIDIDQRKHDPNDFALWKAAKPDEPRWESPWGYGRPGWHIECSAMCSHHLGGLVDIHGGGTDLIFPHHENEIAQSEAFLGTEPFARFWMHNGMLRLGDEKMSKSIGNVVNLSEVISRGRVEAFRLMVLQSHYRAPLTYAPEVLEAAQSGYQRLLTAVTSDQTSSSAASDSDDDLESQRHATIQQFHTAMLDDFNTPMAVATLFDLARAINRSASKGDSVSLADARGTLVHLSGILGLNLDQTTSNTATEDHSTDALMAVLIDVRSRLRRDKQFETADYLRDRLKEEGFTLDDTRTGTTWKRSPKD